MQQATKLKMTIAQKTELLEDMTGYKVSYMSGGNYWIRVGHKHADIPKLSEKVKVLGLEIKIVSVNDTGNLTFQLGAIQ